MKSYSIGRDLGCDIVMNDHSDVVSRRHAVLTVSSSGKMTITDQSSNGTYVNGIRISPNVPVPVTRKDSVSFAHVATLDWNMIPKSRIWVTYLIVALVVAAVAALCVLLLTRGEKPDPIPVGGGGGGVTVTDTLTGKGTESAVTPQAVDSTKTDTVKETKKTVKEETDAEKKSDSTQKSQKSQKKKTDNKTGKTKPGNESNKPKTDTVKNNPRPFGV